MLTYKTAGESHGKGIAALIDGFPAGVPLDSDFIDSELRRRQGGSGRGGRQAIEADRAEILTGVLRGQSMGSPILLWVKNKDYKLESMPELVRPRPGHGDLAGSIKFGRGIRPILERSSARETAGRVAAGALARLLLREIGIEALGYVTGIGSVEMNPDESLFDGGANKARTVRDASPIYSLRPDLDPKAETEIAEAREKGDTLGGIVEVRVFNVPFGLGTHAQWSAKLDGRVAGAVAAIQAIKGVEIGDGFNLARVPGSEAHDEIFWDESARDSRSLGFVRPSNRAGGLEAGMTNSRPIVVRAAMKPIPTLRKPLRSVDLQTKDPVEASFERSDVCAISAASVVVENVVAFEIAAAVVEKFGGDSLEEIKDRIDLFQRSAAKRLEN
ncbi:MAG: chorismate synthase [Thermoguttaceae bacterium]|nr:chorismate synthase [Thermoguttaceae bacterium]